MMKGYRGVSLLSASILGRSSVSTSTMRRETSGMASKSKKSMSKSKSKSKSTKRELPILAQEEDVMKPKVHGTSKKPVMRNLRWGCDSVFADKICNFNKYFADYVDNAEKEEEFWGNLPGAEEEERHMNFYGGMSGYNDDAADRVYIINGCCAEYWDTTPFLREFHESDGPMDFHDSVTGDTLFTAPVGRSKEAFLEESLRVGWLCFRDKEVHWEYVRCLPNGECVSTTGTHLGHNVPDSAGNRYRVNLVSVAGEEEDIEEYWCCTRSSS